MIKALKYGAAAAAAALAPVSASALTFFGSLTDGDTFALSSGSGTIGASTFGAEGPASFTLTILNDVGSNVRLAFDALINTFTGGSITLDGVTVANNFVADIAFGTSADLVVSYGVLNPGETFSATLAAVPLPAAAAMLLTALGGLALTRFSKRA